MRSKTGYDGAWLVFMIFLMLAVLFEQLKIAPSQFDGRYVMPFLGQRDRIPARSRTYFYDP